MLDNLVCSAREADEHWYHPIVHEQTIPTSLKNALMFPEPLARELHYLLRRLYPQRSGESGREMLARWALPPYDQ